ncbi:MAG: hypothetical protein OES24_20355 [Acidimicrobiia bacterium]|nr:hypothetical protein [Acidimicrobiia bacterium]
MSDKTLGRARGLNSIADPSDFKGARGRRRSTLSGSEVGADEQARSDDGAAAATVAPRVAEVPVTPHRAVIPGVQRTRRELSVPIPIAEAVDKTGINPADVVMSAYRKQGDAVYAGTGGRLVSRGRRRLRLSISDAEFDKLTRLGQARGWNRSETVAVLLALELLPSETITD